MFKLSFEIMRTCVSTEKNILIRIRIQAILYVTYACEKYVFDYWGKLRTMFYFLPNKQILYV